MNSCRALVECDEMYPTEMRTAKSNGEQALDSAISGLRLSRNC